MSKKSGLFAGLAVGATLGLLFAPKKGEDTSCLLYTSPSPRD